VPVVRLPLNACRAFIIVAKELPDVSIFPVGETLLLMNTVRLFRKT